MIRPMQEEAQQTGKWTVFALVAIGVFMATLDTSIVNISLPSIAAYFHVPLGGALSWVIIAYLVVIAATLLTAGRLADMLGRKKLWIAGLGIFTLGSALCGAAPSLPALIVFRTLQGLGGSLLMAVSPAMLTSAFPPSERGRALGLNALTVGLGVSAGPTLGGIITASWSWRWIFYVNLPLGMIGIAATAWLLTEQHARKRERFDPLGALLLGVGLAGLTGALSFGPELGWRSVPVLAMLTAAAISVGAVVPWELRHPNPTLDIRLFRNRVFAATSASLVLSFMAIFAVSFMMPFYLEQLHGFSTEKSGLLLTPLPLMIAVFAPISGALADRLGTRWLASSGLAIACIGLVLLSQLDSSASVVQIVSRLLMIGFGIALFITPNNSALLGSAPPERRGTASGVLATCRVVGQSLSVGIAGAVFNGLGGAQAGHALLEREQHHPAQLLALQSQFTFAFRMTFLACAAVAAIGVFASLVRGPEAHPHSNSERLTRSRAEFPGASARPDGFPSHD
jgi:EmrB/QacA subfamily drug resistance transporter